MKSLIAAMVFALSSFTASADGMKVGLGGYCPVAYVEMSKTVYGTPEFKSEVDGTTYHFVNADAKKMFDANPKKYTAAVQFEAWCATGLAALGKKIPSDPNVFVVQKGKVFFFSNEETKQMFLKDSKMAAAADKAWTNIK